MDLEEDAASKAQAMAPRKSIYETPRATQETQLPPKPTSPPQTITNNGDVSKSTLP